MTIKVGVLGARGRMGSQVVRAVSGAGGLELVAELDVDDAREALLTSGAQVVVDFTSPAVVMETIRWCVEHGLHVVVGTSGFTPDRLAEVERMVSDHPDVGVLIAPNFAIGAVLMMQFAMKAAPFFESVEIVEMHHPDKLDAPSGTARSTAAKIGAARLAAGVAGSPDATTAEDLGPRGADIAGVRVHALRVRGMVAHQEVILGSTGELLSIRHDSLDRASFMPGVLLAVRAVPDRPGLTVGIDRLLETP